LRESPLSVKLQLLEQLKRIQTVADLPLMDRLKADPAQILGAAGSPADPWQAMLLRSSAERILMLCSRQTGKSTTAAALALRTALLEKSALVLLLSPTQRQSGELFRAKVKRLYHDLGRPVATVQESALTMELANGSRILSLPADEGTIRGYSGVRLMIVDEASRVPDDLYRAVRPMLAVSRGILVCLSTPFGKRGFFHDEWHNEQSPWQRVKITARECPRITAEFLEEERIALGERWFRQEYECSFEDVVDAVFTHEDILRACCDEPGLFAR
jgi:phage terminase large subunit-like protein